MSKEERRMSDWLDHELDRLAIEGDRPTEGNAGSAYASESERALSETVRRLNRLDAAQQAAATRRRETEDIVAEVRKVARSEVDRAVERFGQQARSATRELQPLVSEYTTKVTRFLRRALIVAFVLVVAWFVFQAIAQQSLLDWIGDRIDNITDDSSSLAPLPAAALLLSG